jgi:predicted AAA+ superfamily ATPase
MEDRKLQTVRQKLGDALTAPFPEMVRREAQPALLRGKAQAVIGMRRAGKTYFLLQCLADRLASGIERERLIYFNFEDERLGSLNAEDLGSIIEEYYRQYPRFRQQSQVTWCFDEIQLIPDWERFARRVLDTENVEMFLSGSSARMLSREVATSMRGRAMEVVITPFSFREFLLGRNAVAGVSESLFSSAERSALRAHFDSYLETGGFPEAGALANARDRVLLLQGYVDTVLFRDVAERHQVSNLPALRAFVRQLLRNPATLLSVSKVYADFRSRGIAVSKESLLEFLDHLEDAFLIFTVALSDRSERRRQVNPRKLYLSDHGLAQAFSPITGLDRGRLIENIVACELLRSSRELAYVKTTSGFEVDFLATDFEGHRRLVQVATDISSPATCEREIRALIEAGKEFPDAARVLVCENEAPLGMAIPETVKIVPIWRFLL